MRRRALAAVGALGALLALAGAMPGTARAGEPDPEDPPLCRAAIEARPEMSALEALAEEEERLAVVARRASRKAKRIMRETLGAGSAARAKLPAWEEQTALASDARRAGKSICYCRERREDPHREDCEILYPMVIR